MTHKDIYTKFMIEYDKANVTSSYPSLTEYEVATVLDKAYHALIAQKVTGNNTRRVSLEADLKSISDIQPLVHTYSTSEVVLLVSDYTNANNVMQSELPSDFLYFIGAKIKKAFPTASNRASELHPIVKPIDTEVDNTKSILFRQIPVKLVSHQMADSFIASATNIPWIKNPVCYIGDGVINIVFDPLDYNANLHASTPDSNKPLYGIDKWYSITYVGKPSPFAKNLDWIKYKYGNVAGGGSNLIHTIQYLSYFDFKSEDNFIPEEYQFECNETVAEELISLAVAFALENVESQRLTSKLNMRGLEA